MPHVHFLDLGICRVLTGNFESTDNSFSESAVCTEIYKQIHYDRPDWSPTHLRTADGRELDRDRMLLIVFLRKNRIRAISARDMNK
jgi:uncharacterized DUF497 family protein